MSGAGRGRPLGRARDLQKRGSSTPGRRTDPAVASRPTARTRTPGPAPLARRVRDAKAPRRNGNGIRSASRQGARNRSHRHPGLPAERPGSTDSDRRPDDIDAERRDPATAPRTRRGRRTGRGVRRSTSPRCRPWKALARARPAASFRALRLPLLGRVLPTSQQYRLPRPGRGLGPAGRNSRSQRHRVRADDRKSPLTHRQELPGRRQPPCAAEPVRRALPSVLT